MNFVFKSSKGWHIRIMVTKFVCAFHIIIFILDRSADSEAVTPKQSSTRPHYTPYINMFALHACRASTNNMLMGKRDWVAALGWVVSAWCVMLCSPTLFLAEIS